MTLNDGIVGETMPTEWEEEVVRKYVNERAIDRPNTSIFTALIFVSMFVLVTGVSMWLVYYILMNVGAVEFLPFSVRRFCVTHPFWSVGIICASVLTVELFFCMKYTIIGIIKLYQHYAPDEIRRRCLFMPTCSEYAIMAVQKYGCIVGVCKSYYRLVYLCRGDIYRIHYP